MQAMKVRRRCTMKMLYGKEVCYKKSLITLNRNKVGTKLKHKTLYSLQCKRDRLPSSRMECKANRLPRFTYYLITHLTVWNDHMFSKVGQLPFTNKKCMWFSHYVVFSQHK